MIIMCAKHHKFTTICTIHPHIACYSLDYNMDIDPVIVLSMATILSITQ